MKYYFVYKFQNNLYLHKCHITSCFTFSLVCPRLFPPFAFVLLFLLGAGRLQEVCWLGWVRHILGLRVARPQMVLEGASTFGSVSSLPWLDSGPGDKTGLRGHCIRLKSRDAAFQARSGSENRLVWILGRIFRRFETPRCIVQLLSSQRTFTASTERFCQRTNWRANEIVSEH